MEVHIAHNNDTAYLYITMKSHNPYTVGELGAAYAVLWSSAAAEKTRNSEKQENQTKALGGLLSKFADDEQVGNMYVYTCIYVSVCMCVHVQEGIIEHGMYPLYIHIHICTHTYMLYIHADTLYRLAYTCIYAQETTQSSSSSSSEEECVEDGVHPCTWWVADCVQTTPLMRLEARTRGMPKAPRRTLLLAAAESLLADGCAALAGQALQMLVKEEGRLDARARALAIRACLAQIADTVKNEASQHASTAYHQGALTRVRLQMQVPRLSPTHNYNPDFKNIHTHTHKTQTRRTA
jgi:hypothetical protein